MEMPEQVKTGIINNPHKSTKDCLMLEFPPNKKIKANAFIKIFKIE